MMSMAKYELYLLEGRPSGRSRVDLAGWRALAVASALPLDLLSLDAWAAGAGRPKEALRTHVTGVRCADADRTVDSLEKLGWQCQVVDVPPWAAARALTLCPAYESERAAACLDWGYAAVTLSLVLGGRPIYARRLKAGGVGDVVAALAAQLDLPLMTAEQLLMRCPADAEVADRSWRAIRKIVADATTHVGREIIRTLDFWRSASSEVEVESLFLIGGGALLPGVAVQVGRACRRPVAMWDMPVSAHAEQPLPPPSLWASAAGLSALAWEEL